MLDLLFVTVDRKLCDLYKRVIGCSPMNKTTKCKYEGNYEKIPSLLRLYCPKC